jgi:hypothetical protein
MSEKYLIGVDGGTESLRAGVFDLQGESSPVLQHSPAAALHSCCWYSFTIFAARTFIKLNTLIPFVATILPKNRAGLHTTAAAAARGIIASPDSTSSSSTAVVFRS